MSTINGSCSASASTQLFEQGIEKLQQQRQLEQQQQSENAQQQSEKAQQPAAAVPLAEGLKGNLFDGYA